MIERLYRTWYVNDQRFKLIGLRLLIIAGVLLLSAGLAYTLPTKLLKLILLLPFGVVGVGVLLRWPPLGLVILTVGGMVIPFVGPSNVNATILLTALLLGLWAQDIIIQKRQRRLPSSRTLTALVVFLAVSFVAFIGGQVSWFHFAENAPLDAQLAGFAMVVLAAAAFVLVADQVQDIRWLKWMTWVFLAFGGLFIAGRVIPGFSKYTRLVFQAQAIGGMFWAWLAPVAFSQAVFNRELDKKWRLALLILVAASFYSGYVQNSGWKSSWVPPLAAVSFIIFARSWRVAVVMAIVGIVPAYMVFTQGAADDAYSVSTRFEAWVILGEVIKVSPLLGSGFGNYYWYTSLFNISGFEVSFNSHNNYIDLIAQTGLVGLVTCLWFFFEVGQLGWYLRERAPAGFAQAYVYGALGGLVGTLVAAMLGDWMLPFVYNIGLNGFRTGILCWLFLGGLVAIEQMVRNGRFTQTGSIFRD